MRENYEVVIGLEIHAQLLTTTKLFCGCSTRFGDPPNTHVCPVCMGLPGALPVLNRRAVELGIRMGLAVDCQIRDASVFARKNYFYPDLPKGYQISQFDRPLAVGGKLLTEGGDTIRITRIHLEEDAGKLLHDGFHGSENQSGVDYNRSGVPLIEIVSEPDLRAPEQAAAYAQGIKTILEYTEVSDANMEQGNLRCDVNVSVRHLGDEKLGTKVEIKNLNSFRFLVRAIEYETERQVDTLDAGETLIQETRLYDTSSGRTVSMRSKEEAHDYRYFPEPDLPVLRVSQEWMERLRTELPELPESKRKRFVEEYRIPTYDAGVLTSSRSLADYFEATAAASGNSKAASNWIMSESLRKVKETGVPIDATRVSAEALGEMLRLIEDGTISGKMGKDLFEKMYTTGESPRGLVEKEGLTQITDRKALEEVSRRTLDENPTQVEQYRKGKTKVLGWLVGQVMKATRGKASPNLVGEVLRELLK